MSKRKTTLAKASTSNKKATKTTNKKGIKKMVTTPTFMKKFKMVPNMVIGGRDAKIWVYKSTQAAKAKLAVKEVKAVKAVKEVKAEPSKIVNDKTQPAVKAVAGVAAVKAVKAQPAIAAIPQKWMGYAIGNTHEIVNELIARLGDQGFYPDDEGAHQSIDEVKFCSHYTTEDVKGFRVALKLCKSAGKYNDPGLKILAEKDKAEKESEKKAEKKEGKKSASKDKAKDEGADWPTS